MLAPANLCIAMACADNASTSDTVPQSMYFRALAVHACEVQGCCASALHVMALLTLVCLAIAGKVLHNCLWSYPLGKYKLTVSRICLCI